MRSASSLAVVECPLSPTGPRSADISMLHARLPKHQPDLDLRMRSGRGQQQRCVIIFSERRVMISYSHGLQLVGHR